MENREKYRFNVEFLEDSLEFLSNLDAKMREKVLENIRISRFLNNPKLLKKVDREIWNSGLNTNHNRFDYLLFGIRSQNRL